MTRKDYELIAEVFRVNRPRDTTSGGFAVWLNMVLDMSANLHLANARFDEEKFEAACMKEKK